MIISFGIDLSKVNKEDIKRINGKPFLDLVGFSKEDSKYGSDGFLCISIPKEDRELGKKGTIVGNFKILVRDQPKAPQQAFVAKPAPQPTEFGEDSDIPF
jgi:hypothetical protein